MKTKNFLKGLLSIAIILSSCSKSNNDPVACDVTAPGTYAFTDANGYSTVYYGGQANRLGTAADLYDALNANDPSIDLTSIWTTNGLASKVADNGNENSVTDAVQLITNYSDDVDQMDGSTTAADGVAGLLVKNSSNPTTFYQLTKDGWEVDQQYAKMLAGALCLQQIASDYLAKVANESNTNAGYDTLSDGTITYYTKAEHYWDEAYGYVYGLDRHLNGPSNVTDASDTDNDPDISGDLFLGKYLTKHNGIADPSTGALPASGQNYRGMVFDAFKKGRQAVTDNCDEVRDEQINIINNTLSKVIAWHASDYLRKSAGLIESTGSDYHHALSEA